MRKVIYVAGLFLALCGIAAAENPAFTTAGGDTTFWKVGVNASHLPIWVGYQGAQGGDPAINGVVGVVFTGKPAAITGPNTLSGGAHTFALTLNDGVTFVGGGSGTNPLSGISTLWTLTPSGGVGSSIGSGETPNPPNSTGDCRWISNDGLSISGMNPGGSHAVLSSRNSLSDAFTPQFLAESNSSDSFLGSHNLSGAPDGKILGGYMVAVGDSRGDHIAAIWRKNGSGGYDLELASAVPYQLDAITSMSNVAWGSLVSVFVHEVQYTVPDPSWSGDPVDFPIYGYFHGVTDVIVRGGERFILAVGGNNESFNLSQALDAGPNAATLAVLKLDASDNVTEVKGYILGDWLRANYPGAFDALPNLATAHSLAYDASTGLLYIAAINLDTLTSPTSVAIQIPFGDVSGPVDPVQQSIDSMIAKSMTYDRNPALSVSGMTYTFTRGGSLGARNTSSKDIFPDVKAAVSAQGSGVSVVGGGNKMLLHSGVFSPNQSLSANFVMTKIVTLQAAKAVPANAKAQAKLQVAAQNLQIALQNVQMLADAIREIMKPASYTATGYVMP